MLISRFGKNCASCYGDKRFTPTYSFITYVVVMNITVWLPLNML